MISGRLFARVLSDKPAIKARLVKSQLKASVLWGRSLVEGSYKGPY